LPPDGPIPFFPLPLEYRRVFCRVLGQPKIFSHFPFPPSVVKDSFLFSCLFPFFGTYPRAPLLNSDWMRVSFGCFRFGLIPLALLALLCLGVSFHFFCILKWFLRWIPPWVVGPCRIQRSFPPLFSISFLSIQFVVFFLACFFPFFFRHFSLAFCFTPTLITSPRTVNEPFFPLPFPPPPPFSSSFQKRALPLPHPPT